MTLSEFLKQYQHYKNFYDFKLSGKSFKEVEFEHDHEGEFIPD